MKQNIILISNYSPADSNLIKLVRNFKIKFNLIKLKI